MVELLYIFKDKVKLSIKILFTLLDKLFPSLYLKPGFEQTNLFLTQAGFSTALQLLQGHFELLAPTCWLIEVIMAAKCAKLIFALLEFGLDDTFAFDLLLQNTMDVMLLILGVEK
jgi:hypothetical protein